MRMKSIEDLETKINLYLTQILDLKNKLEQKEQDHYKTKKNLFLEIINIIDIYENKEEILKEKYIDSNEELKLINNFAFLKKNLLNLLSNYGVTQIYFPENKMIIGYSKVISTEPNPTKENGTIIEIIRNGYTIGKDLIREAEIIVVKN
jgi:molecular chaperone GrpE (heat shock protein)